MYSAANTLRDSCCNAHTEAAQPQRITCCHLTQSMCACSSNVKSVHSATPVPPVRMQTALHTVHTVSPRWQPVSASLYCLLSPATAVLGGQSIQGVRTGSFRSSELPVAREAPMPADSAAYSLDRQTKCQGTNRHQAGCCGQALTSSKGSIVCAEAAPLASRCLGWTAVIQAAQFIKAAICH